MPTGGTSVANVPSAAQTETNNSVWIGASDGYVGQMCILSMAPEPDIQCCNGVNNSRITCICAVPEPK